MSRPLRSVERRTALFVGDTAAVAVAVFLALWTWSFTASEPFNVEFLMARAAWILALPLWLLVLIPTRDARTALDLRATGRAVARAAFGLLVIYLALFFFVRGEDLPRLVVLYVLAYGSLLVLAWRLLARWSLTHTRFSRRALLAGHGRPLRAALELFDDPALGDAEVVGVVRLAPNGAGDDPRAADDEVVTVRGRAAASAVATAVRTVPGIETARLEDLLRLTREHDVTDLVVAMDGAVDEAWLPQLLKCQELGAHVVRFGQLYEDTLKRVPVEHVESSWPITSFFDVAKYRESSPAAKRLFDVVAGAALALAGLALTPVVAALILAESGRPVFYRQTRLGRAGQPFRMTKFRTMRADAEADGKPRWSAVGDPRVTRVGRLLRRTRLDEIPNVLSVLRGEMSMVGPRPERPEFVERLEHDVPLYRARLVVAPGLTGWAQINHPYGDSVEDARIKLGYDLYYIKHQTLLFDLGILLRTIWTTIRIGGR